MAPYGRAIVFASNMGGESARARRVVILQQSRKNYANLSGTTEERACGFSARVSLCADKAHGPQRGAVDSWTRVFNQLQRGRHAAFAAWDSTHTTCVGGSGLLGNEEGPNYQVRGSVLDSLYSCGGPSVHVPGGHPFPVRASFTRLITAGSLHLALSPSLGTAMVYGSQSL